jgi:TonB family protein
MRADLFSIGLALTAALSFAHGEPAPRVRQLPESATVVRDKHGNVRTRAIYAPEPIYPWKARLQRVEGRGLFALLLRANGTVSGVEVLRSTGAKELDIAAAQALIQWRFPPGRELERVKIPVNFTMHTRLKGGGTIHGP